MIAVWSFGFLYLSSSWQWRPHIRGYKLLYPLPRIFFLPFFLYLYLLPVLTPINNLVWTARDQLFTSLSEVFLGHCHHHWSEVIWNRPISWLTVPEWYNLHSTKWPHPTKVTHSDRLKSGGKVHIFTLFFGVKSFLQITAPVTIYTHIYGPPFCTIIHNLDFRQI